MSNNFVEYETVDGVLRAFPVDKVTSISRGGSNSCLLYIEGSALPVEIAANYTAVLANVDLKKTTPGPSPSP